MKEQLEPKNKTKHSNTITKPIQKNPNNPKYYKTRSSDKASPECLICYNPIICQGKLDSCDH